MLRPTMDMFGGYFYPVASIRIHTELPTCENLVSMLAGRKSSSRFLICLLLIVLRLASYSTASEGGSTGWRGASQRAQIVRSLRLILLSTISLAAGRLTLL